MMATSRDQRLDGVTAQGAHLAAEGAYGGLLVVLSVAAAAGAHGLLRAARLAPALPVPLPPLVALAHAALLVAFCLVYRTFSTAGISARKRLVRAALAEFFSLGTLHLLLSALAGGFLDLIPTVASFAAGLAVSAAWAAAFAVVVPRPPRGTACLVFADGAEGRTQGLTRDLERRGYEVVSVCADKNDGADDPCVSAAVAAADALVLCELPARVREPLVERAIAAGTPVSVVPTAHDLVLPAAELVQLGDDPLLCFRGPLGRLGYRAAKRALDIVVSLAMLAVLSPVMLAVAVAIKLDDGGPVFYRQQRLTQGGRTFSILKFRSMRQDAERDGGARLASEGDSRITRVGRVIRAVRLDELPQLVNVLAGSMSLVGPRPERPELAESYEREIPEFRLRLQVKAGLTGYAQVFGRYNTDPYEKLRMDLIYIARPSILRDIGLMFATVGVLLEPEATAGVPEGRTTALGARRTDDADADAMRRGPRNEREVKHQNGWMGRAL